MHLKGIKKLIIILASFFTLLLCCNLSYAADDIVTVNSKSSIEDDFKLLDLEIKDFILMPDSNYDRTDVVSIAESYEDDGNVINYVYLYNPFKLPLGAILISLGSGKNTISVRLTKTDSDIFHGLVKYQFDAGYKFRSEYERSYLVNNISFEDGKIITSDFECNYSQDGNNVSRAYDSYIFIKGKDLFDYAPVYPTSDLINVENGNQYFKYDYNNGFKEFFTQLGGQFGGSKYDKCFIDLMYLNFDTNKEIDRINEIDLSFKLSAGWTKNDWWGNEFSKFDIVDPQVIGDYTTDYFTLCNNDNNFSYVEKNSVNKVNVNMDSITMPASNRLTDLDIYGNLSKDVLSNSADGYTALESFQKRQVSILIDMYPIWENITVMVSQYYKYLIEDLSVMRINYDCDGVTYNARCNSGALITSVSANQVPPKSWWDIFVDWFLDNFPVSLGIIAGVLIGLPSLIGLIAGLFPGFFAASVKVLTSFLKLAVKGIVYIISIPFKILGYLFNALFKPKETNVKKK